jgi:hypothetical protein
MRDLAGRVEQWWINVWVPSHKSWRRAWKTGPNATEVLSETLLYDDEFLAPPTLISCEGSELRFRLLGRGSAKFWKDWVFTRILSDLKTKFPEVGELRDIRDCDQQLPESGVSGHLRAHRHVQPLESPAYCPGSGRSSTAFTTLKMAVLAPMPSARTATVVKAGASLSSRKVYRRSCRKVDIPRLQVVC